MNNFEKILTTIEKIEKNLKKKPNNKMLYIPIIGVVLFVVISVILFYSIPKTHHELLAKYLINIELILGLIWLILIVVDGFKQFRRHSGSSAIVMRAKNDFSKVKRQFSELKDFDKKDLEQCKDWLEEKIKEEYRYVAVFAGIIVLLKLVLVQFNPDQIDKNFVFITNFLIFFFAGLSISMHILLNSFHKKLFYIKFTLKHNHN